MMTDKPTPKKSDKAKAPEEKPNTITKSTQKSAKESIEPSSQHTPKTTVSVNMSDSTKAVDNKTKDNNKNSVDKSSQSTKHVTSNAAQTTKKQNDTMKTASSSQQDKKTMTSETSSKISKVALVSLFIALLAVAGVVFLYFWYMQQQASLTTQLAQIERSATASNQLAQKELLKTLKQQEQNLAMQFKNSTNTMKAETHSNIEQLNEMVEKFSQNQPTDWLVHEAEYLVRIAARTLWLEQDTTAAIGLLQDADARITELNDPEVLPIRQVIYQDIEALKLIPKRETEETILSLMALSEQIQTLPLITMSIPQENVNVDRFKLSEDISDWRSNIAKTWDRFLETFVVVHSRVGELEPILPADQRENLKENLSLKLQIAQWAASKGKHELFIASLSDAQSWLVQYFEMTDAKNTAFNESLESLKSKVIVTDTAHKLTSLKAIRTILADKQRTPKLASDIAPALIQKAAPKTAPNTMTEKAPDAAPVVEPTSETKKPNTSTEQITEPVLEQKTNTNTQPAEILPAETKPTDTIKQATSNVSEAA